MDDEERPYFSAVMSSPSDDGQCTDSEAEIRSPAEQKNDPEDEEVRLRRKLLEKRGAVAGPLHSALSSEQLHKTKVTSTSKISPARSPAERREERSSERNFGSSSDAPISSLVNEVSVKRSQAEYASDDEELFSIQPEDAGNKPRFSGKHRDDRPEHDRFHVKNRRRERSRDEKERRRKERKREKHEKERPRERHRSEEHVARNSTGKISSQSREHGRLAGRVTAADPKVIPRSSSERFHKERERDLPDSKGDRTVSVRDKPNSPIIRKREAKLSHSRMKLSKSDVPLKKAHIEDDIHKIDIKSESSDEDEKSIKNEVKSAKPETDANISSENFDDKHVTTDESDDNDNMKPKASPHDMKKRHAKYSKFESSPEDEEERKQYVSMAVDSESDGRSLRSDASSDESNIEDIEMDSQKLAELSPDTRERIEAEQQLRLIKLLPKYYAGISGCRNVAEFECLNRIEEGTFGVVYRAREKKTDEEVALKRLKMEKEKEGFPITSLREINMLLKAGQHPNIVNVREIVIGSNMDKIYLVMEYVQHDMKSLMDMLHSKKKNFSLGQVKTLLHQLLSGVAYMHDLWILHRDLKTSNLLLSHKGILKIADFGLAREFGDPLKPYTPIVVTLWYRSPELLLGVREYSTAVDMWSVGCIFGEFLRLKPLFPGKGEVDQIEKIFLELGTPSDKIWPGYSELPGPKKFKFEYHEFNQLWKKFPASIVDKTGLDFLNELLRYDPAKRIDAHTALQHSWFREEPHPVPPELFPTWPAKSEGKVLIKSPLTKPPNDVKISHDEKLYRELKVEPPKKETITGFALKFDPVKFPS
ncbi:hypothetical protein AB6A40_005157 [Gnathostoma spinigerum]|uniref:cyclin-dependent kinase n=1 Tax=Gnathostoma spinigerum TaxID=75299 RepID=A0ABD6ENA0_9BILA